MTPDPLSPEVLAELDKLRDIRLPDPAGWWPMAPGWWGLAALCLIVLTALMLYEKRRRASLRFAALAELNAIEVRAKSGENNDTIAIDLAVLLRRVALSQPDTRHFASLSDTAWIESLTRGDSAFEADVAAYLGQAPYIPASTAHHAHLGAALAQSGRWIRSHV